MTTSSIVLIVVIAVVALVVIAVIAWVARNKRAQHRRIEAGDIRDKAIDESHKAGRREALADETAANARVAQAEADAKTAHAKGLQHQAQVRRTNAESARDEVNQEFARADKIDPDSDTLDATPRQDSETRATPRGTADGRQGPPSMPRAR